MNSLQMCFEESKRELAEDNHKVLNKVDGLVEMGNWVIVGEQTVFCSRTDATLGVGLFVHGFYPNRFECVRELGFLRRNDDRECSFYSVPKTE